MKKRYFSALGAITILSLTGCDTFHEGVNSLSNVGYGDVINITLQNGVTTEKDVTAKLNYPSDQGGELHRWYQWDACTIQRNVGSSVKINITTVSPSGARVMIRRVCSSTAGTTSFTTEFRKGILVGYKV